MNRRHFLKTAAIATAGLALVGTGLATVMPKRYVLYGDGIQDDTEALQAWGRGEAVYRPDGSEVPYHLLYGGVYLLSGTIIMNGSDRTISNCTIVSTPIFQEQQRRQSLADEAKWPEIWARPVGMGNIRWYSN